MSTDNPVRGALLVSGAALMFASMGGLIRVASAQMPNEQVVFFRNLFGLLVLVPILWQRGGRIELKTAHPGLHLVRSLFGLAAMYCFFHALSVLPLADAVLLNFTAPLFIPFVAMLWLGEGVSGRLWAAIVIGFSGVLLILKPGSGLYGGAALIGLASGAFAAVAMVSLRKLSATEPPLRVVVYYGVICTLVSCVPMLLSWQAFEPRLLLMLAAAGGFATMGQYLLSRGYGCAPAAQIAPFTYTSVVFAAVYGWLFWQELPGWTSVAGTLLVVVAGVLAMRRQRLGA
ncbi:MAG: DMT family transporter [Thiogranum sp.]|jgi:drug/metabolite transporter (DMT)-like permease|nr:DMT family transporter [Thiogranum sp.]